jgi:hypothetical protein
MDTSWPTLTSLGEMILNIPLHMVLQSICDKISLTMQKTSKARGPATFILPEVVPLDKMLNGSKTQPVQGGMILLLGQGIWTGKPT